MEGKSLRNLCTFFISILASLMVLSLAVQALLDIPNKMWASDQCALLGQYYMNFKLIEYGAVRAPCLQEAFHVLRDCHPHQFEELWVKWTESEKTNYVFNCHSSSLSPHPARTCVWLVSWLWWLTIQSTLMSSCWPTPNTVRLVETHTYKNILTNSLISKTGCNTQVTSSAEFD